MRRWSLLVVALFLGWAAAAAADDSMRYIYHRDPGSDDNRNAYGWRVLRAALDRTRDRYGDYVLEPGSITDERPNATSLLHGDGGITISIFTARTGYEGKLIPVRIPIDRGILGYRLLLIHAGDQTKFSGVRALGDLKRLKFGALVSWTDVPIMRQAGLAVETGPSFDGLFKMLAAGRFDALSRGAGEIEHDLDERRKELPGIVVERSLVLHYPLPVYFWFRDDEEGKALAERVTLGLRQMVADGSLEDLFHQEFDTILASLNLAHRHVIELKNPLLSAEEPLAERALWYRP